MYLAAKISLGQQILRSFFKRSFVWPCGDQTSPFGDDKSRPLSNELIGRSDGRHRMAGLKNFGAEHILSTGNGNKHPKVTVQKKGAENMFALLMTQM